MPDIEARTDDVQACALALQGAIEAEAKAEVIHREARLARSEAEEALTVSRRALEQALNELQPQTVMAEPLPATAEAFPACGIIAPHSEHDFQPIAYSDTKHHCWGVPS